MVIGIVWYNDLDSGWQKFKEIINEYKIYEHHKILADDWLALSRSVLFNNGDIWSLIPAQEYSRGHRCNVSYIPRNINQNIYHNIILRSTTRPPFQAYYYYDNIESEVNE